MKRKIALCVLTTAVFVGSFVYTFASEHTKVNDNEALSYLEDASDSNLTTRSTSYATYSSAVTNRQILDELRTMNKTLTEINNKLK